MEDVVVNRTLINKRMVYKSSDNDGITVIYNCNIRCPGHDMDGKKVIWKTVTRRLGDELILALGNKQSSIHLEGKDEVFSTPGELIKKYNLW